jgi:hypothetical protein
VCVFVLRQCGPSLSYTLCVTLLLPHALFVRKRKQHTHTHKAHTHTQHTHTHTLAQIDEWLVEVLPQGARVGFDPFCHTVSAIKQLREKLEVSRRVLLALALAPRPLHCSAGCSAGGAWLLHCAVRRVVGAARGMHTLRGGARRATAPQQAPHLNTPHACVEPHALPPAHHAHTHTHTCTHTHTHARTHTHTHTHAQAKGLQVVPLLADGNLVDVAWGPGRPALPESPLRLHEECWAGRSVADKVAEVRLRVCVCLCACVCVLLPGVWSGVWVWMQAGAINRPHGRATPAPPPVAAVRTHTHTHTHRCARRWRPWVPRRSWRRPWTRWRG